MFKNIKPAVNVVKKTIAIFTFAVTLRYGSRIPVEDLLDSPQVMKQTYDSIEKDEEQINTNGLIENNLDQQNNLSSLNNLMKIKTGSGIFITNQEISEHSKSALEIRSGELGKGSSPGARAKADARANAPKARKSRSGSTVIPGANGFVPQNTYCRYHENVPLSCKPRVKVIDNPFHDDGNNGNNENKDSPFDASQYKGGPNPFIDKFDYKDPEIVAQKIGFNNPNRLNKSYDKHSEKCFGIQENRNKASLGTFKGEVGGLAQSSDKTVKGSYRYKDPAYIYLKEIDGKQTAVIVNATDDEYITTINPTINQLEDLESNGNIGLDTRPSMQLTLKLRGPK